MDQPRASRLAALAVEAGLIKRASDQSDGRRSLLVLTRAGTTVLTRIRTTRAEAVAAAVSSWTATDRAALARLLPRLVAGMRDQSHPDSSGDRD